MSTARLPAGAWQHLADAVTGRPAGAPGPDPSSSREVERQARRQRAQAGLAEAVARGESLERAVIGGVAALAAVEDWGAAWSLAQGVARLPGGADASSMGHAVLRHRRRQLARVWPLIAGLSDALLASTIPVEAVDGALADGSPDAHRRALAIATPNADLAPQVLIDLAGRMIAFAERDRAADLVAELRRRDRVELDARRRNAWAQIERWLDAQPVEPPAGAVPVGVIDYGSPDPVLTSGNLGDYIQTLALLGNLARLSGVAFTGEGDLGPLTTELQGRVQPQLRIDNVAGSIHLLPINRDFSTADSIPDGTWMVAFGWHMHPLFDLRYDFPYHPSIRPLFVSFHVNRLDMLTEAALAYLRRYGPVGCRDWNTVFLLLSADVDAFFTGCLTTTVDALFPVRPAAPGGRRLVGIIDLPPRVAGHGSSVRVYTHQSDEYALMSAAEGVRAAAARLDEYRRDLDRAIVGRLHAYLPLTSVGVPVELRTRSPGDVRFAGLVGLEPGDPRLLAMRDGIRELLADTFLDVLAGAAEDAVYAGWRERTRTGVAEAKARFAMPAADTPTSIDVAAAVQSCRAGSRRFGPHATIVADQVTDLVLAFDQNLLLPAAVLLESVVANASGSLRLWVLGRGLPSGYAEWLAGAFPSLPITVVPCDAIDYDVGGRRRRIPSRITVSTMDRLLLPVLLDDVRRVVYLDTDTLVLGDVGGLGMLDLGGRPLAARDSNVSEVSEWYSAGRPLEEPLATELRRVMAARHGFGGAALNAGVMVLDLDRMRHDDFTRRYLGLGERYGLHDQDTMLAYVGPERCGLDPGWNALPTLEDVHDPKLIHWAAFPKPWAPELTFGQDLWREYAARLQARAGGPPTTDGGAYGPSGSLGNPVGIGPSTFALRPEVDAVIDGVLAEHLTYLDRPSLRTLASMAAAVEVDGVEGLVIEAGTARGGSAIALAAAKAPDRRMRVYDMFGMIPPPDERDGRDAHRRYARIASGTSPGIAGEIYYGYRDDLLDEVTASFARHGLPIATRNVELVPGPFERTIALDEPVALAHLDGDWYASTMTCLTRIAPLLARGGRLVIDDYDTWSGCRSAVDEYFAGRPGFRFERRGRLHIVRE